MAQRTFTFSKPAPNSKFVSVKGIGNILFGCPSEIAKAVIRKNAFPDYTVLTLRTLRQGRNLIDVEFLFYVHLFLNKRDGKFCIICTRGQAKRVREIISEALFGPSIKELMNSLVPDEVLSGENERREEIESLYSRMQKIKGLRGRLTALMKQHLGFREIVKQVSAEFVSAPGISSKHAPRLAEAWVRAAMMHRECQYFSRLFKKSKKEVLGEMAFHVFDRNGSVQLRKGNQWLRITQSEPCYFELQTSSGKHTHVNMTENEQVRISGSQRRKPFIPPEFGVTFIGAGTGFAPEKLNTCSIIWACDLNFFN